MREAIAGMYGSVYIHNLLILLCYVPIALLIGLGIRPLLAGLNRLFDLKLSETEFMVCEEPDDQLSRSAQLSMLLKASLSQDDLRTQTAEKAQNFEQNYRKMIRYGFLAIIIIPFDLPDTDVQSGIENCIFGSLDHIYHRHRNMAYYCRIHSHKTRRATTTGWYVF